MKNEDKIVGVNVIIDKCEAHGRPYIKGVRPVRESDVVYSAPDADAKISVGWSRTYAANWDATFGDAVN